MTGINKRTITHLLGDQVVVATGNSVRARYASRTIWKLDAEVHKIPVLVEKARARSSFFFWLIQFAISEKQTLQQF